MYKDKRVTVLIAAGGAGVRFGAGDPKQFSDIGGISMLSAAIEPFLRCGYTDEIVVTAPEGYAERCWELLAAELGVSPLSARPPFYVVTGGTDRAASVRAGLDAAGKDYGGAGGLVLIHDAARPYVTVSVIESVLEAAYTYGAAVPSVPVSDTIYFTDENGFAERIPDRTQMRAVQTPQGFDFDLIKKAHTFVFEEGIPVTDDGMPALAIGKQVKLVEGSFENKKITQKEDLERIADTEPVCGLRTESGMRVGIGFDAHRFEEGRKLILGGITIPFNKGLLGHSDADVLTHALMDAILGAMSEGDIGKMFPDNDPAYAGISSIVLLEKVVSLMKERGYGIINADLTVVAEKPRLSDHREYIENRLAAVLGISAGDISLKATTTEKLGFTGREEGIAAEAAVLLRTI